MGRVCCVFFVVASVTVREHCSSGIWVVGCCPDTSVMSAILPRGSLHVTDTPKTDMSTVFLHPSCAKVKVVLALPINALSDMLENVLRVLVFSLSLPPPPQTPLLLCVYFFRFCLQTCLTLHIFYKPSFGEGLYLILIALAALELLPCDAKSWLVVCVCVGV